MSMAPINGGTDKDCRNNQYSYGEQQYAKAAAESDLAQIDTIKKTILARAFRGELGTNDPREPWAGEMADGKNVLKHYASK